MKFWTTLQEPLSQAALIEDGKIIKLIPETPSNTPVRKVGCVARYKDKLIIGKRNSFELWDFDGKELLQTLYSPLIYGLHEVNQYQDDIIMCCTTIDGIFRLDWDGNVKWKWFAHQHGFCPDAKLLDDPNWQTMQLTQSISPPNSSHINSCRVHGNKVLVSLMKNNKAIEIEIDKQDYKVVISDFPHGLHSPVIIDNELCYATMDRIVLGKKVIDYNYATKEGYLWVKRIVEHDDKIFFSHESGISYVFKNKKDKVYDIPLPRPFGIVF